MIASSTKYWPFGYPFESDNPKEYRFGFNGMEKDPEITGQEGSHYTAAFWEYDTRIGRRWNVDPAYQKYPFQSNYSTFNGNPILYADPSGLWGEKKHDNANKEHDKMAKKLAPGRVGDVYNINKGTDKDENWGFNIYKEKEKDKVQSYIFSKNGVESFNECHLGEKSKIKKVLQKADEIAIDYGAPIAVKVVAPIAIVDAGVTIAKGKDLNGTVQKGAWNRVVSPLLTIGTSLVGGYVTVNKVSKPIKAYEGALVIRAVETTSKVSMKVVKANSYVSTANTLFSFGSEIKRIKNDKN